MPTSADFESWFRRARSQKIREIQNEHAVQRRKAHNRKKNKQARASRKKNR